MTKSKHEIVLELDRVIDEVMTMKKQRDELYSIALWATRRLPQSYKPMVYDWIDEATGKESERV